MVGGRGDVGRAVCKCKASSAIACRRLHCTAQPWRSPAPAQPSPARRRRPIQSRIKGYQITAESARAHAQCAFKLTAAASQQGHGARGGGAMPSFVLIISISCWHLIPHTARSLARTVHNTYMHGREQSRAACRRQDLNPRHPAPTGMTLGRIRRTISQ